MNIKNNRRRQQTQESIERIFIELLQSRDLEQIHVSDICKAAAINRSTFYANYLDIYDLADKLRQKLETQVNELYENDSFNNCGSDYLRLFRHIQQNQIFYQTYFKLGYDKQPLDLNLLKPERRVFPEAHMPYHICFHQAGLNAVIKQWLSGGCRESAETMLEIIEAEYRGRKF